MADTCKCGVRMIWAVSPTGARSPICEAPSEDGNVLLLAPKGFANPLAVTLSKDGLTAAREAGVPLRRSHFVDCPDRKDFKR